MTDVVPFKGRIIHTAPPMRVLCRFTKPGHTAEIRERTVSQFQALEFFVFVDNSLLESQMFHSNRTSEYPAALAQRIE